MTDSAYLTLQSGTSRYLTLQSGTNRYLTLQDPPAYANDVDLLLAEATWYIDAHQHNGSETITNLGTGGTALNALNGGGTAVTTNDAKWLAYSAADGAYAYLPGVASNYLSVPDSAALDITGDIDIRVKVAMDDWTPAANSTLLAKSTPSNISYRFVVVPTTGTLRLTFTTDGTTTLSYDSTVAPTVSDGAVKWVRVTRAQAAGEVKFYTSDDGSSWTQLGTTVTGASTGAMFSGSAGVEVGSVSNGSSFLSAGKFYRAQVYNGIGGTKVLDVDTSVLTSGSQTTFTESSSNAATVTVNRSTSGRKTALVGGWAGGGSMWLLGTDDYMEVPDDALLDFGASDSFTVLAVLREWATPPSNRRYVSKVAGLAAGTPGWALRGSGTGYTAQGLVVDADEIPSATSSAGSSGSLAVTGMVADRATAGLVAYINGTGSSATSIATLGDTSNTDVLRVGRGSGAATGYADMEFVAALIIRRALTAGEIAGLSSYFANRAYND